MTFHVLRDAAGLYLLDAGFIHGPALLRRALRRCAWDREPIRGIIVTHGHLDHILNVAALARETGAWIAAPRLDAIRYAGHSADRGWARVGGALETIGRSILHYESFTPDRWLDDGDVLDVWHGLRAVPLPGHTEGHTGFYCEEQKLLFSADLFASYEGMAKPPPAILNAVPSRVPGSIVAALALDLAGVLPNHGDDAPPQEHLARLRKIACEANL